jgi:conjugative relaxase-like TrwC/TraI family protein
LKRGGTRRCQETLREIEGVTATRVRRGGVNEDRITGNMVAAVVTHDTSRALDPQLHTHLCVMNLTFDPAEKRWKGLQPYGYLRNQGYFREVCYQRLAQRMSEAGYELEPQQGIGSTIRGFPERLRSEFSERRRKILETARERGVTTQGRVAGHPPVKRGPRSGTPRRPTSGPVGRRAPAPT